MLANKQLNENEPPQIKIYKIILQKNVINKPNRTGISRALYKLQQGTQRVSNINNNNNNININLE